MDRRKSRPSFLARLTAVALVLALSGGCAARSVPILVAQSALGTAQAVGALQVAAEQLHRAGSLTTPQALSVQQQLLKVNQRIALVIPTLKAIDRMQQAGAPITVSEIDQILAVVIEVSQDLSLVVAGVPVAEPTRQLLELVRASQQSVAITLVEIARLRAALEK